MKLALLSFLFCRAFLALAHTQTNSGTNSSPNPYFGQHNSSSVSAAENKLSSPTPPSFFTDDTLRPARYLVTAAEDFVVEVYLNGKLVPAIQREQAGEIYGSIAEKDKIEVKPGDWVVFNVVNDRLRWGTCYFGVAGMGDNEKPVFVSRLSDARWSCCDDPGKATEFITQKDAKGDPIQHISNIWADGAKLMREHACKEWNGDPIWGKSHNTWIKFVYR